MKKYSVDKKAILKIAHIYYTLQGESSYSGLPFTIVRLWGCPHSCRWCDTSFAKKGPYIEMTIEEVLNNISDSSNVLVTGGEPLFQKNVYLLIRALCRIKKNVLIETSGLTAIGKVDKRAHIIMDVKCPSSSQPYKRCFLNMKKLKQSDQIKFVIASRSDYEWAKGVLSRKKIVPNEILFSPVSGKLKPGKLADWILQDKLQVRLQIQLHKILWPHRRKER